MEIKSFRDLLVWQKAMDFVVKVYRVSACFPREELYGLTSQVRRAAVSVPSNISEGHGRETTPDFLKFLGIAYGSLNEAQTQILIGERLGFINESQRTDLIDSAGEVARLLNGLRRSLVAKLTPNP